MWFLKKKNKHYKRLKKKWEKKHQALQKNLVTKHKDTLNWVSQNSQGLAVSSLGGLMLLTSPQMPKLPAPEKLLAANNKEFIDLDKNTFIVSDFSQVLPDYVRPLTPEEESKTADIISRIFGIKVTPELNGIRLNRSYGYIGKEQHLYRFPGDTLDQHTENPEEWTLYHDEGIAPGLGAWRYFAPSATEFSEKDKLREKYYIAVQTFLAPGFNEDVRKYVNFFKYRKMLLVNPENGKAMVTVIGDAGPAEWTGKSLGGSPEVMHYLERVDGRQKGPVIYMFIDDPEDKIPLGPIDPINYEKVV